MIDEERLRKKLQNLWKRHPPVTPASFAAADELINEVVEASTITITGKVKQTLKGK